MISTKHTGELENTGKMHYASKKDIIKPDVIVEYNANMGGVDNLRRVIDSYAVQGNGLKWYRKLAELFVEICIYNSYIVYKGLNRGKTVTHLGFRQILVKEMFSYHMFGSRNNISGERGKHDQQPLRLIEKHFIRTLPQKPKKAKEKMSSNQPPAYPTAA